MDSVQVVAGVIYNVVFKVSDPCTLSSGRQHTIVLEGKTFEPLPSSNQLPKVMSVERLE